MTKVQKIMQIKKITLYGTNWCADCVRSRYFLDSNKISYKDIDIEKDDKAREYVLKVNDGNASVPVIVIESDGKKTVLVEPTNEELKAVVSSK